VAPSILVRCSYWTSRLLVQRLRGAVYVGTTSLAIREVYWELFFKGQEILNANGVYKELFDSKVLPLVQGQSMDSVDVNARNEFARIHFSNAAWLDLDTKGKWPTEDAIAELTLRDGQYIQLFADGKILRSADRDLLRMHAHAGAES
jgi:hypothetical protein